MYPGRLPRPRPRFDRRKLPSPIKSRRESSQVRSPEFWSWHLWRLWQIWSKSREPTRLPSWQTGAGRSLRIASRHLLLNGTAFIGDHGLLSRSDVAFDPVNSLRGQLTIIDSAANLKFYRIRGDLL